MGVIRQFLSKKTCTKEHCTYRTNNYVINKKTGEKRPFCYRCYAYGFAPYTVYEWVMVEDDI